MTKALKYSYSLILNLAILGNNQSCTQRSLHEAIHQIIDNAENHLSIQPELSNTWHAHKMEYTASIKN